jgi:hypothetical protein
MVEIITFACAFTNACKNTIPTMPLGDIVDQFLDNHSLTNTSTAEGTNLTAFHKGADQIDNLDTSLENLNL